MKIPFAQKTVEKFDCPHCTAFAGHHMYDLQCVGASLSRFSPPKEPVGLVGSGVDISAYKHKKALIEELHQRVQGGEIFINVGQHKNYADGMLENVKASRCEACDDISIWVAGKLVYPLASHGAAPHDDMPEEIKADYLEASSILQASPRGAAALLRLVIQKLCDHLEAEGNTIFKQIGHLVGQGLREDVQEALDIIRFVGNEAVHPPEVIDLRATPETAAYLFELVNYIVDQHITQPAKRRALFGKIPENKRGGIEQRDTQAKKKSKLCDIEGK